MQTPTGRLSRFNVKKILPANDDEKKEKEEKRKKEREKEKKRKKKKIDFHVSSNRKAITTLREPMLLSEILNVHTSGEQLIKSDLKTQTVNCIKNEIVTGLRFNARCPH